MRVYSPSTLLDASRTRNVPSGVFLITSFTPCLIEPWKEMLTICQNAELMPAVLIIWAADGLNLCPYVKVLYTLKCFPSTTPHVTDGCHQSRSYTLPSLQLYRYCVELLTTKVQENCVSFATTKVSHWNKDYFRVIRFLVPCKITFSFMTYFWSKSAKIGNVRPVACWTSKTKLRNTLFPGNVGC